MKTFSTEECETGTRSKIWNARARTLEFGEKNCIKECGDAKAKSRNAATRNAKAFKKAHPSLVRAMCELVVINPEHI